MAIQVSKLTAFLAATLLLLVSNMTAMPTLPSSDLATILPSTASNPPDKYIQNKTQVTRLSSTALTWISMGCFDDEFLQRYVTDQTAYTKIGFIKILTFCQNKCSSHSSEVFAGVVRGYFCACMYGNQTLEEILMSGKVDDKECTITCQGDSSTTCGGAHAMNIYKPVMSTTETTTAPEPKARATTTTYSFASPVKSGWIDVGCFRDDLVHRSLINRYSFANESTAMTVEMCQMGCQSTGYNLAGLESGQECYCDLESRTGHHTVGGNSDGCDMPCTGKANEGCGGQGRIYIYKSVLSQTISKITSRVTLVVTSTEVQTPTMVWTTPSTPTIPTIPTPDSTIVYAATPTPTPTLASVLTSFLGRLLLILYRIWVRLEHIMGQMVTWVERSTEPDQETTPNVETPPFSIMN